MKKVMLILAIYIVTWACKKNGSDVKVTNGQAITEDEYPYVRYLLSRECTLTVLSSSVTLTAAHCVADKTSFDQAMIPKFMEGNTDVGRFSLFASEFGRSPNDVYAVRGYIHPAGSVSIGPADLAVGVYRKDSFKHFGAISPKPAKDGDPITLVGYGVNDAAYETGGGIKRKGTNTLSHRDSQGMLHFQGRIQNIQGTNGTGEKSASGVGDSGGPLFAGTTNQLVGVTSGGSVWEDQKESYYVDVHSKSSKLFFLYLTRLGVDIPLPNGFLDEVKDIPFGIYADLANSECKAYVAGAPLEEGITLKGCGHDRFVTLNCNTSQCTGSGFVLSDFQPKTFMLSENGSTPKQFTFVEDKNLKADVEGTGLK
ncbi:MAG: trypsin-like serine protease [Oligoflexales bacterium]